MDPELYVFPKIEKPALKFAASSALFALIIGAARLLLPQSGIWAAVSDYRFSDLSLLLGYSIFIYASYQAWIATREKNLVEEPKRQMPTRLLETGAFARVRHPMYGMFILANAGMGLAAGSLAGLIFSLLSLLLFVLNGIFEERAALLPLFGEQYREYMRRVPARYFTPAHLLLLVLALALNAAVISVR